MNHFNFEPLILEGSFQKGPDGVLRCLHGDAVLDVFEALQPLVGSRCRVALHFTPRGAPDASLPGFGSCLHPESCPLHKIQPHAMLSVHGEGVLVHVWDKWALREFDGSHKVLPFDEMIGHHGRVLGAALVDVSKMQDAIGDLDPDQLASMGVQAEALRGVLDRVRQMTKKGE